jgi:VanZ family protein
MTSPDVRPDSHTGLPWWLGPSQRRAWLALLLALAAAVCWLAFSPAPPPAVDTGWDKANHALAFAALAVVAELAFWPDRHRRRRNASGLMLFGAFIELVQARIPQRSGEWSDLLADACGIGLGLAAVAVALLLHRKQRR